MLAKRVIPCLDVHDGQVTRGVQFGKAEAGELRNVGDPVTLALRYNEQGADEMDFFDITASAHGRRSMIAVIERAADQCFMPLTVGGGIRSVEDMSAMLKAGADKISIISSALATPDLIRAGAEKVGSQCIVVSIDATNVPFKATLGFRSTTAAGAMSTSAASPDESRFSISGAVPKWVATSRPASC